MGVGVVGTARFCRGCPPEQLKKENQNEANFNDFNYMVEDGTLLARWMDNGLVFCVSTLHKVGKTVLRNRRRPRITDKNKNHVREVWGDEGSKPIFIPQLIDDYNHWMGGVDLSDQRIAYYQPNLRCRRNWIPMFIQMLSIIRSNSYIVYKSYSQQKTGSHKQFTLDMIDCLMSNAHEEHDNAEAGRKRSPARGRQPTRSKRPPSKSNSPRQRRKRIQTEHLSSAEGKESFFSNFPERKAEPRFAHARTSGKDPNKPGACIYCSYLFMQKKEQGEDQNYDRVVKRTSMVCQYCSTKSSTTRPTFLCKEHFDIFHDT